MGFHVRHWCCGETQTYITAEDIIAFIRRHAMSLPLSLAPKMIEEGKGAYTPEGKMTLQDMKQASGFRKQRTIVSPLLVWLPVDAVLTFLPACCRNPMHLMHCMVQHITPSTNTSCVHIVSSGCHLLRQLW